MLPRSGAADLFDALAPWAEAAAMVAITPPPTCSPQTAAARRSPRRPLSAPYAPVPSVAGATLRCRPIDRLVEGREVMTPLHARSPDTDGRWVLRVAPAQHLRFDTCGYYTCGYSLDPSLDGRRVDASFTDREGVSGHPRSPCGRRRGGLGGEVGAATTARQSQQRDRAELGRQVVMRWVLQAAIGPWAMSPSAYTIEFQEPFQHWSTSPVSGLRV